MSIATLYVKAKSKKALNEALAAGQHVDAAWFKLDDSGIVTLKDAAKDGDVIKIYEKLVSGSPYAKAYGNWDAKKGRVK